MQLELPLELEPIKPPCSCGCSERIRVLEQELETLHAYLRVLAAKRKTQTK